MTWRADDDTRSNCSSMQDRYLDVTFVQGACDDEHNVVYHVAVGAVVHEFPKNVICLQDHDSMRLCD